MAGNRHKRAEKCFQQRKGRGFGWIPFFREGKDALARQGQENFRSCLAFSIRAIYNHIN